jgi:hypothetical protein
MTPDELTRLHNSIKHLLEVSAKHESQFTEVKKIFLTTHDSIKRLERIAVAHETRLARLEKRK